MKYRDNNNRLVENKLAKYTGFSLRSFRTRANEAITQEAKEKLLKKYEVAMVGAVAHIRGISVEQIEAIQERPPKVVFMVGLPCSGKSTYIRKNLQGFTIISFDDLIVEMWGNNYNEAYKKYETSPIATKEIVKLQNRLKFTQALLNRENVVLDFTNLSKSFIEGFYDLIPIGYKKEIVVLDTDFETILERNQSRKNKFIPVEVLESIKELFKQKEWESFEWDREVYL